MADLDIDQMKRRHKLIFEKKNPLIVAIDKEFGEYYWNVDFIYEPNKKDLDRMFDIVNETMFGNKLPKLDVKLMHENHDGIYGSFCALCVDEKTNKIIELDKPFITVINWGKDNFSNVLDTLCHEMIHAYDYYYGPAKKYHGKALKIVDGKQLVEDYEIHGSYFQQWIKRFANMEIDVTIHAVKNNKFYLNKNEVMKDNEQETKNIATYEEQCEHIGKVAKQYFDHLKSEEYVGITVDGNKMYIVIA